MRHWDHPSFRLPRTYVALCEFVHDNRDFRDDLLPKWQNDAWGDLLLCDGGPVNPLDLPATRVPEDPVELSYSSQPMEILPFGWEGGDALHFGWAVLAPELDLDDHPCVSFAPIDGSAVWLGDDTKEALENLLVGRVANWASWASDGERSPVERSSWAALCRALDLRPRVGAPDITAGARSNREIRPAVPPGWWYEPANDGIGVLAPASAFEPDVEPTDDEPNDGGVVTDEDVVAEARELVTAGYPATALVILKEIPGNPLAVRAMRDAYGALGRTLHVQRAEAWLRFNNA